MRTSCGITRMLFASPGVIPALQNVNWIVRERENCRDCTEDIRMCCFQNTWSHGRWRPFLQDFIKHLFKLMKLADCQFHVDYNLYPPSWKFGWAIGMNSSPGGSLPEGNNYMALIGFVNKCVWTSASWKPSECKPLLRIRHNFREAVMERSTEEAAQRI